MQNIKHISNITRIEVGGIEVDLVRKEVRNLNICVYPPDGRVRVAAPFRMSLDSINSAVAGRLDWIRKHQLKFASQAGRVPWEYRTGECHYFMGRRYRLNIQLHDGRPKVELRHGTIEMHVPQGSDTVYREALLYDWYRQQMKEQVPELLAKWEQIIGVRAMEWGIKRMKTRWGTCNIMGERIWLNLELIRRPQHCMEYIIAHELTHLHERLHNDRFKSLMDMYMPQWRQYKAELDGIQPGFGGVEH